MEEGKTPYHPSSTLSPFLSAEPCVLDSKGEESTFVRMFKCIIG